MPKISVRFGDALAIEADVLALKYAQAPYGVDALVLAKLAEGERKVVPPKPWEFLMVPGVSGIVARRILLLGVPPLREFRYRQIREFARRVFASLAGEAPETETVAMTVHGPGYGLDEDEAFESEIAGVLDACDEDEMPDRLRRVVIVERNRARAARLGELLSDLVPGGDLGRGRSEPRAAGSLAASSERLRAAGYASEGKAHIFVAMPFKDDMEDVFHYGIQSAARTAGFLCERADMSSFTGDVMEWVKSRIKGASLVIADLSEANPNVYLEVGYAWGCGVKTVLLVKNTCDLKFDVKNQRCLVYKKIKELEENLATELKNLNTDDGS